MTQTPPAIHESVEVTRSVDGKRRRVFASAQNNCLHRKLKLEVWRSVGREHCADYFRVI